MRGVQENQLPDQPQQEKNQGEALAQEVLSKMPEAHIAQRVETIIKTSRS